MSCRTMLRRSKTPSRTGLRPKRRSYLLFVPAGPDESIRYPAYFTSHDEFEIGSMHWIVGTAAYAIANGQQNANSPKQNYWPTMYRAIRYCNIFLEGIGTPRDIPEYERKRWIAEVKFLKAYYHYWLVSLYGPAPSSTEIWIFRPLPKRRWYTGNPWTNVLITS